MTPATASLLVAHAEQLGRMAEGDQAAKLAEFMGKYPDPDKVDISFVPNLLAISRKYMRGMKAAKQRVPSGVRAWRAKALARFEATLPVEAWRLIAKSNELPSLAEIKRAKDRGGPEYADLSEKIRAIGRFFSDTIIIGMFNISDYASDLRKVSLLEEHFERNSAVKQLKANVEAALEVVGEADWRDLDALIAVKARADALIGQLKAQEELQTKATGAQGYGEPAPGSAAESRTKGNTPASVAIRLRNDR